MTDNDDYEITAYDELRTRFLIDYLPFIRSRYGDEYNVKTKCWYDFDNDSVVLQSTFKTKE